MTDTHYKIAEAVRKINETATERECADLLTYSGCLSEKELLLKLIKATSDYVIKLEQMEFRCRLLTNEKDKYYENYRKNCIKQGIDYRATMSQCKNAGIYPADKKISCEVVKRLKDEGLTQEQVAEKLGISRSTVCRKLKEAKDKGFENKPQMKWGW